MAGASINGGQTLPLCTESLTVVAYWYDPLHERGAVVDVDLYLKLASRTAYRERSEAAGENKERVHATNLANETAELVFYGFDVDDADRGYGPGAIRVHWAFFWESAASGC